MKWQLKYDQRTWNEAKLKAFRRRKGYRRRIIDSDEELMSMQPEFKSKGSHMLWVFLETLVELILS